MQTSVIEPQVLEADFYMDDIQSLDLNMIKVKLQDAEEGQGWSSEKCDEAEIEYKRFFGA